MDNEIDQITKGLGALCIHDDVDDLVVRLQRLTLGTPSDLVPTAPAKPDAGPDIDNSNVGTFVDHDMDILVRSTAKVNLNECCPEERSTHATSTPDLPIEDFANLCLTTKLDTYARDDALIEVTTDEEELPIPLFATLSIEEKQECASIMDETPVEEVSGARLAR